ncbi:MAG: helicase, partial [Anaerolineae bacterium]|nr:helicase [Anaerolineae bacterium]
TELNVVVSGNANHEELTRWFEALWAESEDFDVALMRELESSWALAQVTPYDIYLKTLYEMVRDRLDEDEAAPMWTAEIMSALTDFQTRAVERAVRVIRQYGGCFVSDVVGMGKSYIGAAIVKHFERTERARPLIVCPAPLVEDWERYNEAYQLNARVLSMGHLREDEETGANILLDDVRYRDRDFVLVDESHNFRHTDTQRYRVLEAFLAQGRHCVLLTATPRNKSVWDIYHQLRLFHQSDHTDIPVDPPNLREYFHLVEENERQLPALLSNILIRRTRNHILRWYGYDSETGQPVDPDDFAAYRSSERRAYVFVAGEPNFFPQRQLEVIDYNIEQTYQGLYQKLRAYMGPPEGEDYHEDLENVLTYARYGLWKYVKRAKQSQPPYDNLYRAGINLRGLMRVSMFKRLESSVYAFQETLRRQLAINRAFLQALQQGIVAAGEDAQGILYESDRYEEDRLIEALEQASGRYDIADFKADALQRDIQQDIAILEEMLGIVEQITPERDDKLQTLLSALHQQPFDSGKCLIFTQFADTARYLHEQICATGQWPSAEVIFSDRTRKASVVGRFAPKANPSFVPKGGQPEIDLLIATDVLSEGLNLQDCDKVINYDLHWNPVRLIQRFGRIDRIGSKNDVVYGFNFLPETALDEHLGLRDKLHARIQEIHDTIGEDTRILDPSERLNEEAMYAIYESRDVGQYEEDEGDEFVAVEEAEEIIRQLQRDNPAEIERIKKLRDGIRCGRGDEYRSTFAFCRAGDYQQLYLLDENGEIATRDAPYILGKLRCSFDEPPIELPDDHNSLVTHVKRQFEREANSRKAERRRSVSPSHGQKYVMRELRLLYGSMKDEAIRTQIQALDSAFRQSLPRAILAQLNGIQKQKLSGERLLGTLLHIYERHNLAEPTQGGSSSERDREDVPRIVCSEAFL